MEEIANSNPDHEFVKEMNKFVDSKAGVKGLVDSGLVKVPRIFIQPPECFLNPCSGVSLNVPVIDLKGLDNDHMRKEIVNEIREAAETWGICQLINHGVPVDVIDSVLEGVIKFHEQPPEVKNEFTPSDTMPMQAVKFTTSAQVNGSIAASWKDILVCLYPDQKLKDEELPQVCRY
ncbi:hypothetical protein ACFE04_014833 [Oxalis oulophora]